MPTTIIETLNAAISHYQSNQLDQSKDLFLQALEQQKEQPVALHFLGLLEHQKGDSNTAISFIQRALKADTSYANAHHNLALILENQAKLEEAIIHYKQTILSDPSYGEAYFNLARVLHKLGDNIEALEQYRKLCALYPNHPDILQTIAYTLSQYEQLEEAIDYYQQVIDLSPYNLGAINNLGVAYRKLGQYEQAKEAFRRVISFQPTSGSAYLNLVQIAPELKKSDLINIHYALTQGNLAEEDRIYLNIALGLAYQKTKIYDKAFSHMQKGNKIYRNSINYNHRDALGLLKSIEQTFNTAYFDQTESYQSSSFPTDQSFAFSTNNHSSDQLDTPIFIMGMPRSGSTLVEQIISSHPDAFGTGETVILDTLLAKHINPKNIARSLATINDSAIVQLANDYLTQIRKLSNDSRVIINKKLDNYLFLGIIVRMFPNAKIIHCKRDPLDNSVSCFFNWFHTGQYFTYDLKELGEYYQAYETLMQHWKQVLPIPIMEIRYEELIADQETVSRNILSFCGLDWHPECLSFHDNSRSVITNSDLQVRQPIYQSSLGRWKHYEAHLTPLIKALRLS